MLQTGCDDQSLRLSDLQQQYEFKCNEIEVCTVSDDLIIWFDHLRCKQCKLNGLLELFLGRC